MNEEVGAIRGSTTARQIRRVRARRLLRRFVLWVIVPTLLSTVYFGFWASPQYESVAVLVVQSNKGGSPALEGLAALVPSAASSPRDAMLVREYALSRTMLDLLVSKYEFKEHYESASADYWARLSPDASTEDLFAYYRDKVHAGYSPEAGTLSLRVRAFSPEAAEEFATAILKASEEMVNQMSNRARQDRMDFAAQQVRKAEKRLAAARKAVAELQTKGHDLNPEASAKAVLQVRTQLEGQLATLRSELSAASAVMTAKAPQVLALRRQVHALEQQVKRQNDRLVDVDGTSINKSLAKFEPALFEKEIAYKAYEAALRSMELVQTEVLREQRYVETISPPSRPNESTHPRRLWGILTVFASALVLMGVITMLWAALREHAKF